MTSSTWGEQQQQGATPKNDGGTCQQTQRQSVIQDRRGSADCGEEDYILPTSPDDPLSTANIGEYTGALNGDTPDTGEKLWCGKCGQATNRCHGCQQCLVCHQGQDTTCAVCMDKDHTRHTHHHPMD